MPNNATVRTKSGLKSFWGWAIALLLAAGSIALTWWLVTSPVAPPSPPASPSRTATTSTPWKYQLTPARTAAEQEKGLSGTSLLAANQGMLFIYHDVAERCFWMKNMRYSLDIIWTDAAKKVTHIEKNVSPATYPRAYCAAGQYVIELLAGEADKSGLHTGQILGF